LRQRVKIATETYDKRFLVIALLLNSGKTSPVLPFFLFDYFFVSLL